MNILRWAAAVGAVACTLPAFGQAPAPTLTYSSAFAGYRPYQDLELADWRLVNETVRQAAAKGAGHGAHGGSTRPSSDGGTSATTSRVAPNSPASVPTTHGSDHSGHGAKR